MSMEEAMSSKTALVTGGSGGIGKACGRALAELGYDVLLVARRPEPLRAAAEELGVRWLAADCTDERDIARIVDAVPELGVLVHTAGMVESSAIRNLHIDLFDRILNANLRSTFLLTRSLLDHMRPGSHLIYLSSTAGLKGVAGLSAYSASKAGMNAFANAVAAEVEPDGIGVHIITPGPVRTEMLDSASHGDLWLLEPDDVARAVAWITGLPPRVVIREILMRSTMKGPYAPRPLAAQEN
jgi:NAD(P)-dependent dehydrogenase (short-subunit alcohol dehydrogenase family)